MILDYILYICFFGAGVCSASLVWIYFLRQYFKDKKQIGEGGQ